MKEIKTIRMLSELIGCVRGLCLSVGAEFWTYRPSEWRRLCLDEGEESPESLAGYRFHRDDWKAWSMDRVKDRYSADISNDNASDAVLIGIAHINDCKINEEVLSR